MPLETYIIFKNMKVLKHETLNSIKCNYQFVISPALHRDTLYSHQGVSCRQQNLFPDCFTLIRNNSDALQLTLPSTVDMVT